MLLLPAHCESGKRERVREAQAILAFVGLSRTIASRPSIPVIVHVPTPEAQTCFDMEDRLDAMMSFIDFILNPNRAEEMSIV